MLTEIKQLDYYISRNVSETLPAFEYDELIHLEPGMELLIDDVSWKNDNLPLSSALNSITELSEGRVLIRSLPQMMNRLNERLESFWQQASSVNTVLLFPGTGSRKLWPFLPESIRKKYLSIAIQAQRTTDPVSLSKGEVQLDQVCAALGSAFNEEPTNAVILDDALNRGTTASAIASGMGWKNTQFTLLTPIANSPLNYPNRSSTLSSVPGISYSITSVIVDGPNNGQYRYISSLAKQTAKAVKQREQFLEECVPIERRDEYRAAILSL